MLISSLFNDRLSTKDIEIWLYETEDNHDYSSNALIETPNIIHVYGKNNYSINYAKNSNPDIYGLLIYNATTLVQYQNQDCDFSETTGTDYTIHGFRPYSFNSYGAEAQSQLFEDYAETFILKGGYIIHKWNSAGQIILKQLLESRFPGAKKLRLHYEAQTTKTQLAQTSLKKRNLKL